MFVLHTGLQGNGKTLNTIREVDQQAAKEGREVYYHNIREFNPDHPAITAVWKQFDNPHEWFKLPQNSIIVIDEAQTFFRVRPQGMAVPEYASALEVMRHSGHELHCITQNPGLIDTHFRKLCNSHIHYVRGHKGQVIKRWAFERVNMDVEKKNEFTDGESTRLLIDKAYFGCYKSVADGSTHHFKFKAPKALYVFVVCLIVIAVLGYRFYQNRLAGPPPVATQTTQQDALPGQAASVSSPARSAPEMDYFEARTPRVPDVPSSAPIYDELTKPVAYPKAFCMSTKDVQAIKRNALKMDIGKHLGRVHGCRCNTQQGTRLYISFSACMNYAENGAFDHARPDASVDQFQQAGTIGPGEVRTGTMAPAIAQPVQVTQPRAIVTVGGGNPGHLW
jgi:zona occludens toxin